MALSTRCRHREKPEASIETNESCRSGRDKKGRCNIHHQDENES